MPLAGDYLRRAAAEFVGTFALVFVSCGALLYGSVEQTAFAYGLVIAVMVSAVGAISGGHFNPAVTLGFVVTRRITMRLAAVYWLTQLGAAALGALLLKWVLPTSAEDAIHLGAPRVNAIGSGEAVVVEAVLTFFLVWVFFATAVDPRGTFKQIAGLAIGLTVTLGVMMAGGMTMGIFNPARAFGPQLVGDEWTKWWIWYLGPLAGAAVAAVVYELLYLRPAQPPAVGTPEGELFEPRGELDEPQPGDTPPLA